MNSAQSSQVGSIFMFQGDPRFNFELHVISRNNSRLTTELHVIAMSGLNGVKVKCHGFSGSFVSFIRVSVGELISSYNNPYKLL